MKRLFFSFLIILYFVIPTWAAHIYVEKDPGNPGKIMYNANGWPSNNAGKRTENSDIDAAIVAAGASGIIEISGGPSGVTYSSTELDATDGLDVSIALTEFKGSSEYGHNGTVTISGTGLNAHLLDCTGSMVGTISNITFTDSQTGFICIYCQGTDVAINDCNFIDTERGIHTVDASITVNRCLFDNCSYYAIAHAGMGDTDSSTFNYCKIVNCGSNTIYKRAVDLVHGNTIIFNNCMFVNNPQRVVYNWTGNQNVNFNNCIFSGNIGFQQNFHIIHNLGDGTVTATNCILLPHPDKAESHSRGFVGLTDGGNNVFGSPGFISNKRPAYFGVVIDDYANLDHWMQIADECHSRGFNCSLALSKTNSVSKEDWATLQEYVNNGHEVASHSRHHVMLNSMNAFKVQYTGAASSCTMTIDLASNSITTTTTGGVDDLSIDISDTNYYTIGKIHAYINSQANYTASTASTNGNSDSGIGICLADITNQDIKKSEYTCLFDQTRYFNEEIVNSKADIEANLTNYTCKSFVFPYSANSEEAEDAIKDAGYLGARAGTISNMSYSLENLEIFRIRGVTVAKYIGTTDDTGGAFAIMNIPARIAAYAERMGCEGAATIFFAHSAAEYSLANWVIILDAIKKTNSQCMTLGEMISKIRAEGSTVDNETWTRSFSADESNYHLDSFSSCINAGTNVSLSQDFEKQRVPRDSTPDIGVYEYCPKPFVTGSDYITVKYDSAGNELWVARYNDPGSGDDYANAIAVDASGNLYVTGRSEGNGTSGDYTTVKYDNDGNELWVARYNGPGNGDDYACALAADALGNVYVTGYSFGSGTSGDYATMKYDTNGNQLWVQRYNGSGNGDAGARAIAVDAMGNIYVTGYSFGSGTDSDYTTVKYVESVIMDLPAGWSMISLPVRPELPTVANVFPEALVVYRYQKEAGYVRVTGGENLEVGMGYWILIDEPQSYVLRGTAIPEYTIPVADGWYMIGVCSMPAQKIVTSGKIDVIYGYRQGVGYQRVPGSQPLDRGKGYWIKFSSTSEGAKFTASTSISR